MSYNGSGTFVINTAGQPVVSGTVISSTAFNALTADLATGLSTAITKDGQTTPTANIPMGNNKITNLAVGTAATDAANLSQVQSTTAKLVNSISGADTITGTMSPTLGAYATGQMFYFIAAGDNTGAVTLNIDSLGAKSVTRDGTTALAAGDIQSGEVCVVVYDGTRFQLVNGASQSASIVTENLTVNKATVLNESGGDNDTRIEGDTDANLFFVDASTDRVGIGTNAPLAKLNVVDTTVNAATALVSLVGQNSYNLDIQSVNNGTGVVGNRYNFAIGSSGGEFSFSNSGGERARITNLGALVLTENDTKGPFIRSDTVISFADGATLTLINTEAGGATINVYNTNSGRGGSFFATYTLAVAKIAGDGEATDTGAQFAVYKSANSHTVTFKNRSGGTDTYAFGIYSAKAVR